MQWNASSSHLFAYGLAFFLPFLVLELTEQHKCRLGWLGWLLWGLRFRVSSLSFVAIIVGFIRTGFGRCWSKRRVLILMVVVMMMLVILLLVVVVMMVMVMLIIRVWLALESKESEF